MKGCILKAGVSPAPKASSCVSKALGDGGAAETLLPAYSRGTLSLLKAPSFLQSLCPERGIVCLLWP